MATINTMLDLLVQPMYNAIRGTPVRTNNTVAKLHYKVTSALLVIIGFLVTSAEHFGNAIDCFQRPETVPSNVLETYCWLHSTFTLPDTTDTAHPGVYTFTSDPKSMDKRVYHKYYQWVCLVLIMQSVFFYLPRYLWRLQDGSFFRQLLATDDPSVLSNYISSHQGTHTPISISFHATEFLFLINLIVQVIITDVLLDYQFIHLGKAVFTSPQYLQHLFPRLAKCTFYLYGYSGDLERQDALCLLGQNVFNEKIFLFFWFWYVMLFILSVGVTLWRIAAFFFPICREFRLLCYCAKSDRKLIHDVVSCLDFHDWFVLVTISKNLSPIPCRNLYLALGDVLVKNRKNKIINGNFEETQPLA